MIDFDGVKAALLYQEKLLVYLRDDKPGLRFANMWDFFGGGREDDETPIECLLREVKEELDLNLSEGQVVFQKVFPAMHDSTKNAYFMVAELATLDIKAIHFGSEGQRYVLMSVEEFMDNTQAVPLLKGRLQSYLDYLMLKS